MSEKSSTNKDNMQIALDIYTQMSKHGFEGMMHIYQTPIGQIQINNEKIFRIVLRAVQTARKQYEKK